MYFDDVLVTHRQGLQVQENHYDPFGLDLAGLSHSATPENKYTFNGKERQDEFGLNWHDHGWRFYDPALGRWVVSDPDAEEGDQESWGTYQFGLDNAVRYNDLDGRQAGPGDLASPAGERIISGIVAALEIVGSVVAGPELVMTATAAGILYLSAMSGVEGGGRPAYMVSNERFYTSQAQYNIANGQVSTKSKGASPSPTPPTPKPTHGNSKSSNTDQHGYKIKNNKTGETAEYGVSGQKLKGDGTSPRVAQKLRTKYKNNPDYSGEVVKPQIKGAGGRTAREKALNLEQGKVNSYSRSRSNPVPGTGPPRQDLPTPKV